MQTCWNDSTSGARTSFLWASENSTHWDFHRLSREQHSLRFSPIKPIILAYFDTLRIPRIHRAAVFYFLQMLLHNGRWSVQTLIVTLKTTTVDRLNNDWSSKTVSGIQHKQDSTLHQHSLNAMNKLHCQLAESATHN